MVVPVAAAVAVAEVLELDIIAVEAVNEVIVLGNEVVSLLWSRQCRFFHLFLYYCWHFQCHAFYFCQRGFPWHLQLGYSKAELEGCVYIYNKKYVLVIRRKFILHLYYVKGNSEEGAEVVLPRKLYTIG